MKEGGEKSWEEPYTFWQTQCELRKHRQIQVARETGPTCVPGEGSLEEAGRAEQQAHLQLLRLGLVHADGAPAKEAIYSMAVSTSVGIRET